MNISIVIPVASLVAESIPFRIEALQHALCYFYKDVEVIIVEQSLDGKFYVLPSLKNCKHKTDKLIEIKYKTFNKSWCINVGVDAAKYDNIVICDCDMYARPYPWGELLSWINRNGNEWGFAWDRLMYVSEKQRLRVLSGANLLQSRYVVPTSGYHEGGMVFVKKDFFYKIGQANECFQELGGMDNDFAFRCGVTTKTYPMFPCVIHHIWHHQTPKKNRPTRRQNIKTLKRTHALPTESIKWLTEQDQGNVDSPLIARKEFLE